MPTIKDIAKAAGVSHGTVSNVLNKRGGVSYEKIRLVEQTARALGYSIDEKASLLRRGTTKTLSVVLPDIAEPRYADLYTGILREAEAQNYSLRLFLTDGMPYLERRAIEESLTLKVCGILTVSCLQNHKKEYAAPLSKKIPVLFLEHPAEQKKPLPSFTFSMQEGAKRMAEACRKDGLPDKGKLCAVTGDLELLDQAAFRDALGQTLPLEEGDIYACLRYGQSSSVLKLLLRDPLPEAVFCSQQSLAEQTAAAFEAACLPPPRIYALTPLRPEGNPRFSTFSLNYRRMGKDAVEALLGHLEGKNLVSREYACSTQSGPVGCPAVKKQRTLRVLAHETPTMNALKSLLPRFCQKSGLEVELHTGHMDMVFDSLLNPDASAYDVVRLDPSSLPYFGPRYFTPLNAIDPGVASQFNHFLPGLQTEFSAVGGQLYALPFDIAVQLLFYQKSVFEDIGQMRAFYEATGQSLELPSDYEEFDRIVRFFSKAHRPDSPIRYGSSLAPSRPTSVTAEYLPRLLAAGGLRYSSNGCLNLLTPGALQALEGYVDFATCTASKRVESWSSIAQDFVNGQTATAILFANHSSHFVRNQSANVGLEIGFAPIPGGHPLLGGGSLCIHKNSSQKEDAYDFIRWATGEDIAPKLVMLGGVCACRCIYEQQEVLDTYPWLAELPRNIRLGIRQPILSPMHVDFNQREFESVLGKHLLSALSHKETPEEALEKAQQELDAILR